MPKSMKTDRCVKKEGVKKKSKCDYGGHRKIKILMTAQDQRIKGGLINPSADIELKSMERIKQE